MDFFEAQELARKRTRVMVVLFLLAVLAIATALYSLIIYVLGSGFFSAERTASPEVALWQPNLFFGTLGSVIFFVLCCSLFKIAQLRSGGAYVARSLGGREVSVSTKDADERRLLNVVEEMSIASGVPMPKVYLLPEDSINAFAAGFRPSDAVVAVTHGCIRSLNRDELQGVIAHEFSHILNGDMRMNIRIMGVLFGILAIAVIGQLLLRSGRWSSGRRSKGGSLIIIIGLSVMLIGYIGVFFGRLIQSAISRQREYLADAAAVQFTRNPDGIAGALKKIGGGALHGQIASAHAEEAAHLFFASAFKSRLVSLFATHPPLEKRIQSIEPGWDGKYMTTVRSKPVKKSVSKRREARTPHKADDFIRSIGQVGAAAILTAQEVHGQISKHLDRVRQSIDSARSALLGLIVAASPQDDDVAQLLRIKKRVSDAVYQEARTWVSSLRAMNIEQRFALFDVALPIAAGKDLSDFVPIVDLMRDLASSDDRIQFQEFALLRVASVFIKERASPGMPHKISSMAPKQLEMRLCVLLSAIAYTTGQDEAAQATAFREGARKCNRYLLEEAVLLPKEMVTFEVLETALDLFEYLPNPQKKVIFEGAIAVVLADGKVAQDELSLIRIIAISLGLPMPPLVIGETQ